MRQYLESQDGWPSVEMLPGYSSDQNRVQGLWGSLKCQGLANRCIDGLGEAERSVCDGMERILQSRLPALFCTMPVFSFDLPATLLCEAQ